MVRWIPYALVRIVVFLIGGIWLAIYFPSILPIAIVRWLFLLLIGLYYAIAVFNSSVPDIDHSRKIKFSTGVIGLSAIFLAGYLLLLSRSDLSDPNHLEHFKDEVGYYTIVVTGSVKEKESNWKVEGAIRQIRTENRWMTVKGKVLLYFPKISFPKPFQYGDVLLISGHPQSVPPPSNPEEFNYKRFLSFKNIFHQHFLKSGHVRLVGHAPPLLITELAFAFRSWAEAQLKQYVPEKREQSILSALVLGITDGLDEELLSAYAAAGAMHVLAVSGLHVGIIYALLLLLLKPLNKTMTGKWIVAVISVVILWLYAFVTGLSPSVLRAVTMFTFIAFSRPISFRMNIYNTLAASAFVLLLFDPYLVVSVGFQLSYLAVLGIVYIQPHLQRIIEPGNSVMMSVWKIMTVSIAAQLATFALGLLYFHQFPNYFIFSNFFVIPGSAIALVAGLAILAFSSLPVVATVIGIITLYFIKIINTLIFVVEAMPLSIIEDVYINTLQCWLLMGMVASMVLLFRYRRFSYLLTAAGCVAIFAVAEAFHFKTEVNQKQLLVYDVNGHSAIEIINHGQAYFFTDPLLEQDDHLVRFHIRPNRLRFGVDHTTIGEQCSFARAVDGGRFICFANHNIVHINQPEFFLPANMPVDYLIIGRNAVKDFSAIEKINCKNIILDSSNSYRYAEAMIRYVSGRKTGVYSVLHRGAFISQL